MAFVQRVGERLLMRLARGLSADFPACSTCLPSQLQVVTPSNLWSFMGVRRMAGGEEPASGASREAGVSSAAPQPPSPPSPPSPPPPGSAPSRKADPQAGLPSPSPSTPDPSASSSSSSASSESSQSDRLAGSRATGSGSSPATASSAAAAKSKSDSSRQSSSKPTSKLKPRSEEDRDSDRNKSSSDDEDTPDNVHKYHAFWQQGRMRNLQPRIEEGMRMNAYEGLQGFGGFMRGQDQAWSFLYDSPSARLTSTLLVPLWSAGVALVRPLVVGVTGNMIRDELDGSFETREFVESVSQAVPVFFDAAAAMDTEALYRMCTPRAVEALGRDRRRLREDIGLEMTRIDATVRQATLAGGNLWGPDSIRAFDPAWASDTSPNLSKSWLVVGVYLDVSLLVSYRRVGSSGGGGGGEQAHEEEFQQPVRRWGTWLMARGPLPKGPAESLDCPWKLLAWY